MTGNRKRPGGNTWYDRTNTLTLTAQERRQGWEIVKCITCDGEGRRGNRECTLCKGRRKIKVFNGDGSDDPAV